MTIAIGGVLGWVAERRLRRTARGAGGAEGAAEDEAVDGARRRGVLLASGFLVGESFVGVLLAAADLAAGHGASLAVAGPAFEGTATWLGLAVFAAALAAYLRLVSRAPARAGLAAHGA